MENLPLGLNWNYIFLPISSLILCDTHYIFLFTYEALAKLGNDCVATVQAYDCATENMEALNAAELKLQDIINSPSLDAACKKIDDLAEKNQFDSALVLMITKAWSAAKESNMTKDEVKWLLASNNSSLPYER